MLNIDGRLADVKAQCMSCACFRIKSNIAGGSGRRIAFLQLKRYCLTHTIAAFRVNSTCLPLPSCQINMLKALIFNSSRDIGGQIKSL